MRYLIRWKNSSFEIKREKKKEAKNENFWIVCLFDCVHTNLNWAWNFRWHDLHSAFHLMWNDTFRYIHQCEIHDFMNIKFLSFSPFVSLFVFVFVCIFFFTLLWYVECELSGMTARLKTNQKPTKIESDEYFVRFYQCFRNQKRLQIVKVKWFNDSKYCITFAPAQETCI